MAKQEHDPIGPVNEFCPDRGTPCECGNHYQKNCVPDWAGEGKGFDRFRFAIGKTGGTSGWEAHHVLSVSCVNWKPKDPDQSEALMRALHETKWCINNPDNMIGMPLWGHTIMYYVQVSASDAEDNLWEEDTPPGWANIPQHDFEHNTQGGYCTEVKDDIKDLWNEVGKAADEAHPDVKTGLQDRLNALSKKWFTELKKRGTRMNGRGTHESWKMGTKEPTSDWYYPFSMANDAHVVKRNMPFNKKLQNKIRKIQKALRAA
jgi:hypothetical protein